MVASVESKSRLVCGIHIRINVPVKGMNSSFTSLTSYGLNNSLDLAFSLEWQPVYEKKKLKSNPQATVNNSAIFTKGIWQFTDSKENPFGKRNNSEKVKEAEEIHDRLCSDLPILKLASFRYKTYHCLKIIWF